MLIFFLHSYITMGVVTPKILFFFFYFVHMAYFYNIVYICGGGAHTWRSSNNRVGLGDQTQIAGLGGRRLYLLNYLISCYKLA